MRLYASAYVLEAPYHIDHPYEYYLPEHLEGEVGVGSIVSVPFGMANRRVFALVTGVSDKCEYKNAKPVYSVCDPDFSLGEEMIKLCFFLKEQTLCTIGEALRCMVPSSVLSKAKQVLCATENELSHSELSEPERTVYSYVLSEPMITQKKLSEMLGEECESVVARLLRKGYIRREYILTSSDNTVYKSYIDLSTDRHRAEEISLGAPDVMPRLRSEKQRLILSLLVKNGRTEKGELLEAADASSAQLKALIEKGLVSEDKIREYRNPYKDVKIDETKKNILSDEQRAAFLELRDLYRADGARAALLWGVTGSGKTRVMKSMIDEVVADGRTVIVLVPEISLTPQTVGLFCSFYGESVAVLHSALSQGEKLDAHRRIREGKVSIVIGTRSAIFAPLSNVGLIIIDEEQEHTYKSDADPKYHAKDVARFRAKYNGALMLLCSATPSVESFYKAKNGTYSLVCLRKRYGNATLPDVRICDMRKELRATHVSPVSRELIGAITETKQRGEQSIVFLNRRGYNNFVSCRECGESLLCPHCSVSLTIHRDKNTNDTLRCHYCGYTAVVPRLCPYCNSDKLMRMGVGIQKAAEEINLFAPDVKILRMDADTVSTKQAYDEILGSFRNREADLLLGTQMVAKGHDFPDVTLVGVLGADASMAMEDFRANERTFSLLTQVVGRAGRASKKGVAIIQSFKPESEILSLCTRGDYEEFYEKEIELRRSYIWPPFCDMVLLTLCADNEPDVMRGASILSSIFNEKAAELVKTTPVVAYGPFEAPIYKLNEKYRMRMVVKTKLNSKSRALFSEILTQFLQGGNTVTLSIDLNPSSI